VAALQQYGAGTGGLSGTNEVSGGGSIGRRPLLALVSGLGRRLEARGALSPVSNMEVVAMYSTHLIDLLPKQWAEGEPSSTLVFPHLYFGAVHQHCSKSAAGLCHIELLHMHAHFHTCVSTLSWLRLCRSHSPTRGIVR
jgi:hypothetical protein